jgi:hypothetical protein
MLVVAFISPRGLLIGLTLVASFFVISTGSAYLIDYFLNGYTDADRLRSLHFKRRALLEWMPWPLGVFIGCLPALILKYYEDRQWRLFLISHQTSLKSKENQ